MPEKRKIAARPSRAYDYKIKTVSGFAMRSMGEDSILFEGFVDLPPLGPAAVDPQSGEEMYVLERVHEFGVMMSYGEARRFAERILGIVDAKKDGKTVRTD